MVTRQDFQSLGNQELPGGTKVVKRHVNQLKSRFVKDFTPVEDVVPVTFPSVSSPAPDAPDDNIVELELRRSARDRHPSDRYMG